MKPQCEKNHQFERGIALVMFTLALPALLGLAILGVDLGNIYVTRDKLNLLNRSAAATAINIRAFQGWAPLACDREQDPALGYKCANAIGQSAPQGEKYGELVQEIKNTLTSQIKDIFPDTASSSSTSKLIEYKLPASGWRSDFPTSTATDAVYNLKTDTFQLRVRYAVKTILLSQLASLLNIEVSSLCDQASDATAAMENRCWVTTSDSGPNSATTKARVIMLLDTSGSMQDKLPALKTAAGAFIDYFNPFKDEIGIIPYGTGVKAGVIEPRIFNEAGSQGLLTIKNSIASLDVGGQTNPCDALIESDAMIPTPNPDSASTRTFVVFFTDGAPNVYRLRFCEPGSTGSGCVQPSSLNTLAPTNNDWYGWTVKWGRRETHPSSATNNPVYGHPTIRDKNGNLGFDTVSGPPANFRINENGDFMIRRNAASPWCNMEKESAQCPAPTPDNLRYRKVFSPLTSAQDNYLWNGPSYLVNRDRNNSITSVTSLIDRVGSGFKTCGIPKPSTGPSDNNPDQFNYNHSLYFASRVIDKAWSPTRSIFGVPQQQAVWLKPPVGTTPRPGALNFMHPPTNLTVPFYASDGRPNNVSPVFSPTPSPPAGCLDALDAEIPVSKTGIKLFVGAGRSSFWSNTTSDSIGKVGEIIKTAELPYYCAIRAADYLRKGKNTTIFAVGLGKSASRDYGENCGDPMQNALDFDKRKDFFLQRLALSPEAIKFRDAKTTSLVGATWQPATDFNIKLRSIPQSCDKHPLNGQDVYLGFSEECAQGTAQPRLAIPPQGQCKNPIGLGAKANGFHPDDIGGYYPTNDPNQLKAQFGAIAKQILFRLSL